MPTISAFYGIVTQMFWQDHAPPHFHALYAERDALISVPSRPCRADCHPARWPLFWNGRETTKLN
jgi:hypothetical protein